MRELYAKWDRHVAHDFEEQAKGRLGRLRWLGLAVAVGCSPAWEAFRIARSARVRSFRERALAFVAVCLVRWHRMRRMAELTVRRTSSAHSRAWNRS
jgi:hypothetical protein